MIANQTGVDFPLRGGCSRRYTIGQLPQLNRILALKDLGLSLGQIARLLAGNVSTEEIRGMLRLRQSQLREQAEAVEVAFPIGVFRIR